jgi:hypothetical protein
MASIRNRVSLFASMALVIATGAQAYSHIPVATETLAEIADCAVEGVVQSAHSRREGPAIVTDISLRIENAAGDCPAANVAFTQFGGRLASGEAMGIAGVESMVAGQRYIVLLERGSSLAPLYGPQGVLRIEPVASGKSVVSDLTSQRIGMARDGAVVLEKAHAQAPVPSWELDAEQLFERLARSVASRTREQKRAQQQQLETGFRGVGPRSAEELPPRGAVAAANDAEPPAVRAVQCTRAPLPAAPGEPQCGTEKYVLGNASGLAWNIPPSLGSWVTVANNIMTEWNKFTDHFRVLTSPADSWGFNARNDFGGWPQSADLQRIHGYSWGASVLGVMIYRTDFCVEVTNEYFLGILINSYCSRYQPENDVFLNPAYSWTSDDLASKLSLTSARSVYSVLAHEMGHGFGLSHSTLLALMTACDDRKGWQPFPDDAAGARARWPATARYLPNLGVRLLVQGSNYSCASSTQPDVSRTPVGYSQVAHELFIGSFMVTNTHNVAASNVSIDWFLTSAPGGPERTRLVGTTSLATVQPGVTSLAGPRLAVPPLLGGTFYLTAVVRDAGSSSAAVDASNAVLAVVSRALVQFEAASHTVGEASSSVTLRVVRTGNTTVSAGVSYETTNGTAVAGTNFTAASGTLSWGVGDTTPRTITINLRNDGVATASRQFGVRLFSPALGSAVGTPGTATVTVIDDRPDVFPVNCALPSGAGWANAPAGATVGWVVDANELTEGRCSLKSAPLGHATASAATAVIELTADFAAGNVQFDRRVSSEAGYDCLVFSMDGVPQAIAGTSDCASGQGGAGVSGEQAWSAVSVPITAGRHTLRWTYSKDSSIAFGGDAAWIDNLRLPLLVAHQLAVSKSGAGAGSVASVPAGIDCGAACAASFPAGATVVLTATPAAGSVFAGWSGGGCTGNGTCTVQVNGPLAVTAEFTVPASWTVAPGQLDFGGQSMGTTSPPRTVTITNTGGASLTLGSVTPPPGFLVSHGCSTLAPGASCDISVRFAPPVAAVALNSQVPAAGTLALTAGAHGGNVSLSGVAEKSLVTHYYQSLLRRTPDAAGKAYWESEAARVAGLGAALNEAWFAMAAQFITSAEYRAFNRDTGGYLRDLYITFFNREPDTDGLGYWAGLLGQGMPREVVLASFMFSAEFDAFTRGIFGGAAVRAELDVLMDFYRGLLARLPDSGGFNYWLQRFRAAQCSGAPAVYAEVEEISKGFAGGSEYVGRNRDDGQFVGDLYNAFLRRGGDLAGVGYWMSQLGGARTRDNERQAFITTPEFAQRVQAIIAQGCLR